MKTIRFHIGDIKGLPCHLLDANKTLEEQKEELIEMIAQGITEFKTYSPYTTCIMTVLHRAHEINYPLKNNPFGNEEILLELIEYTGSESKILPNYKTMMTDDNILNNNIGSLNDDFSDLLDYENVQKIK